jgi:hypothetical protein
MKIRCLCFLLLFLGAGASRAQDLSGVWTGNYSKHLLMTHPQKLVVELYLHDDSLITGASHLYYRNNQYEHYTLVGRYNPEDSMAYFREDSTLGVNLGFMASNCLGQYSVKMVATDTSLQLVGKWSDNASSVVRCPTVKVFLDKPFAARKAPFAPKPQQQPKPVARKETIPEKPVAPEKTEDRNLSRAPDIQSLIEIAAAEKDSIRIELYDNKEIDGDIVSLYFNDNMLLHKQALTAKPLVLYVSLNRNEPVNKIKMAAESMGSAPPCTAMMRITTGKGKHYEVNLSSNYAKNAVVELFLKE